MKEKLSHLSITDNWGPGCRRQIHHLIVTMSEVQLWVGRGKVPVTNINLLRNMCNLGCVRKSEIYQSQYQVIKLNNDKIHILRGCTMT